MRIKHIKIILLLCFFSINSMAQGIPDQWEFINNYTQLRMGKQTQVGPFNDSLIRTIDLTFPQSNYWTLMTNNYASGTNIPATLVYNGTKTLDSVGVRFKGNTSYTQVNGDKKSFNIEVDWINSGQDIGGYKTFNLNNCYQDESFLREVLYCDLIKNHIPGLKTGFTKLTINGQDWGLYPNIQQLNKDMYEDWFTSNNGASWRALDPNWGTGGGGPGGGGGGPGGMWGQGNAALNYLGTNLGDYQDEYTLKFSDFTNPWDELRDLCDVLNNTPIANLEDSMKVHLDLDRTLWFLASEIAFTDDDGYVYKGMMDYYVFKEEATGQWVPMEFDGNSCMDPSKANSWSPFYNANDVNYPLLNRLLQVPSIRQRYLAHMRTIIAEELDQTNFNNLIDYYASLIDADVQSDPKKLYTYNQFLSEVNVLKSFISTRRNALNANAEVAQNAPTISTASHYSSNVQWQRPAHNQSVDVKTNVSSTNGINAVNLYYSTAINGQFTKVEMFDDGMHNDGAANDGEYGQSIPGFSGGTWIRYYVEAVANNSSNSVAYLPVGAEHDVFVYLVEPNVNTTSGIVINEVMAANDAAVADNNGEYDDWIELYNTSGMTVDLSGWSLTDDQFNLTKFTFPSGTSMPANTYLTIWADEDGSQGWDHANFKLSSAGETVRLLSSTLEEVDQVTWTNLPADSGYARDPNGTGAFVVKYQTFNINNNWPLAVNDVDVANAFQVYPNPANQFIDIKFSGMEQSDNMIEVFNITGKRLARIPFKQNIRFDISTFAQGMYMVRFGSESKKFVVQH